MPFRPSYSIEERKRLINTAMGREPADLVVTSANVVSVATGEVLEDYSVIVSGSRIAGLVETKRVSKHVGPNTIVIDAKGSYIVPGFIEPHVHIESSLLDPYGFAKLALKHGTTTAVVDPHEIANVLGVKGVEVFAKVSASLPMKILIEIPSCVPATDPSFGLETAPHVLGPEDIRALASLDNVIGLGEVMDFVSVVGASKSVLEKVKASADAGMIVDGHAPLLPEDLLNAYISAGILSDHESTSGEEAVQKARRGMYVFIRQGSAWKDLRPVLEHLMKRGISCELCTFATDDISVVDLVERGHMDRIVNEAVELGMDPVEAIKLATLRPAARLGLLDHVGLVAPGRFADMFTTARLENIVPETVISSGEVVYLRGELKKELPKPSYPESFLNTVNIKRVPTPEDFVPKASIERGVAEVNVIEVAPGSALTKRVVETLNVEGGKLVLEEGELYVSVIERHRATGSMSVGVLRGLGLEIGAVAQTIAHDTHNLIVAGKSPADMSLAVEAVFNMQGGIVAVDRGRLVGSIELRLAGLMSVKEPEEVYAEYKEFANKLKNDYGLEFENFFMTLSLVALPVIPEIRITDRGLVNVAEAKLMPLILRELPA